MPKKSKSREWDDGRTVADMNLEGMPWHGKRKPKIQKTSIASKAELPLTRRETWSLVTNALVASLLIGLIFAIVVFIFIMFCIHVWFK